MKNFYKNKKVLITGHTGFKGSWLVKILSNWEANICGYSIDIPTKPNLYELLNVNIKSITGDIRDYNHLKKVFDDFKPEIVIHMAAQPIVRESYNNPLYTYQTNVMGTVNICECVRLSNSVKSFLNVTTDKVYENKENPDKGYVEEDSLNGYDPYSNSKSCSDIITQSYNKSFFSNRDIGVSTIRSGNVIGGGDFAKDRIIPDCVKAALSKEDILIRNPFSTRPYQHVLEPIYVYLLVTMEQYKNKEYAGYYNIGPNDTDCITTGNLVDLFVKHWGDDLKWITPEENKGPHEANFLKLNSNKIKNTFNWKPHWGINKAIEKTVEWTKIYQKGEDINKCMDNQINEYLGDY